MKRMMFEGEMKDFRKREIRIKNLASLQRIGQVVPSKKQIETIKLKCQHIKTEADRQRSDWMTIPQIVDFKPTFNMYKAGDLDKRSNVLKKFISAATLIMRKNERKRLENGGKESHRLTISPTKSVAEKTKSNSRAQEKRISNIKSIEIARGGRRESLEKKSDLLDTRDEADKSDGVVSKSITPRPTKKKFVRYVIPKNPFSREALPKPPAQMTAPPIRPNLDISSTSNPAQPSSKENNI